MDDRREDPAPVCGSTCRKKTLLFKAICLFGVPVLFLVVAELGFRAMGYRPRGSYLKQIDRLEVYNNFYVDTNCVYRARSDFEWGEGIVINEEGFRAAPSAVSPWSEGSGRLRLMILGDSFGWGYSADPIALSFADLLASKYGVHVVNLSIPGTGPDSYAIAGLNYIPRVQPDVCAVFVYLGNDINLVMEPTRFTLRSKEEREWYVTNAGIFSAYDRTSGRVLPPEEAYRKALAPSVRVVNLLRRTALGTQLVNWAYDVVYRSRIKTVEERRRINGELIESLRLLQQACASNQCELLVFPIPVNPIMRNTRNSVQDNECLFEGFDYHIATNLAAEDYAPFPDDHFNNRGHAKFADFVAGRLDGYRARSAR